MMEGSHTIRRWIMGILVVQVGFALILMGADVMRSLPALLSPSEAPALLNPVGPGDQRRRFDPRDITFRTPAPNTRPVPSTQDMPTRLDFTSGDIGDRPALTLTGTIAPGDGARFADWVETHTRPEIVFLNSPGGSVTDAIDIGRQLRGMQIETAMTDSDICLSACPYILAGGVIRDIAPGAMVGVHQHYFGENIALPAFLAVEDIQRGQGEVMGYLIEMGIDPAMMEPALLTPPDEIYVLLPEELERFGLISAPPES